MRQKILKSIFLINSIIMPLLFFITNGRESIIMLYPLITIVLLLVITIFNSYYLFRTTENKIMIIAMISIFLSYPLVTVFPFIYMLITLSYLVIFIIKKNVVLITLCSLLVLLTIINIIKSDYFKLSKDSFNTIKEKTDLGFSPSGNYYSYCIDETFYVHRKKDIIGILESFSGNLPIKAMTISVCDKEKIKWITDDEIEVDGKRQQIINDGEKIIRVEN